MTYKTRTHEQHEQDFQVANTILAQLGGNKAKVMAGMYDFVSLEPGVQFSFKGSRKANKCRIILDPNDTYTFELWKITKLAFTKVYDLSGVYCDMLIDLFESETGLYLSL